MNTKEYTEQELKQLHEYLYKILEEIARVCDKNNIPYFIQGGSGIGAFFEQAILPWDDDIDVGLTRDNYWRFLEVAPRDLKPEFFLQWVKTDPHTPFYFAKVRMNNTMFVEGPFKKIDMHHGIYVDVFPYDKVPDSFRWQKIHQQVSMFFNGCFMGKDVWQWEHCGKCDVDTPRKRAFLGCLLTRIMCTIFSKESLFKMLTGLQAMFNNKQKKHVSIVLTSNADQIPVDDVKDLQTVKFGTLMVKAPNHLEDYLRHHYKNLRHHIPKEEQQNHRPEFLSFDTSNSKPV